MSHPDPTFQTILVCDRCGEEVGQLMIGDEFYDNCEDCGVVEGATHEETIYEGVDY